MVFPVSVASLTSFHGALETSIENVELPSPTRYYVDEPRRRFSGTRTVNEQSFRSWLRPRFATVVRQSSKGTFHSISSATRARFLSSVRQVEATANPEEFLITCTLSSIAYPHKLSHLFLPFIYSRHFRLAIVYRYFALFIIISKCQ